MPAWSESTVPEEVPESAASADGMETRVDARGTRCPMPVIMAARAARGLPGGSVLVVLASDPAAAADLPAWCRMRGHTVIDLGHAAGQVACRIRLGG